jgi:hypothetical protein
METLGSAGLRGQETTVVGELALITVADRARGLPLGRWVWGVFATTWCDSFRMFTANACQGLHSIANCESFVGGSRLLHAKPKPAFLLPEETVFAHLNIMKWCL